MYRLITRIYKKWWLAIQFYKYWDHTMQQDLYSELGTEEWMNQIQPLPHGA